MQLQTSISIRSTIKNPRGLIDQLVRHEAFRRQAYKCSSGKLTIGVGRNIDANGVSEDEANYMLLKDINDADRLLRNNLPTYQSLNATRQNV
ncbi:hypothetical protein N9917_04035, partial [Deltaproteobacteria bacterium]|nr:hypothetical protein [Deltaproteobacteria bacterium]